MQKKKTTNKKTAARRSNSPAKKTKNSSAKKKSSAKVKKNNEASLALFAQVAPFLLIVLAVLLVVCFFTGSGDDPGIIMGFFYKTLTGFLSSCAFFVPLILLIVAVLSIGDKKDEMPFLRYVFGGISIILLAALLQLISPLGSFNVIDMFNRGVSLKGGGVIGGLVGELFLICFKTAGSYVLVIALLLLSVMLTFGITPKYLFLYITYRISAAREKRAEKKEETQTAPVFRDPGEIPEIPRKAEQMKIEEYEPEPAPAPARKRRKFNTDVPVEEAPEEAPVEISGEVSPEDIARELNISIYNDVLERTRSERTPEELEAEAKFFGDSPKKKAKPEVIAPESEASLAEESAAILDMAAAEYMNHKGDEGMPAVRESISEAVPEVNIPKPEYVFPPRELLSPGENKTNEDIRGELHENAARLVKVLASFNVKTKIIGVSRGPTITRYELLPEAGTRVRSIANLVDDIALNLATSGVRIEAPIPGKAAVGIEVPNKSAETVYLRTLLDTADFSDSKSRITTALGKNVGGETVIMDIKKMPHLLIAGATGMGKSVCINCLIVSLLYKATPDEVKLILIDPKKVEFSVYNGLPHLLVPVVSDPKKAAGSLNWAVNEMERRFSLIESVGVRDIASYNEITKNDPEREYMPQIVIIIDELADLMSTAPDDVETSIARLAAKARAAGMHLVIGTQRPSVDVITGVIKANIPSRIAFTVASQVDSRTIIDRSGAENLIGRGDMLYNPVGAAKPMRVQGAFVSESEVDAVVSYIKEHNSGQAQINDAVLKEIEAQAAMCGVKKGSGSSASAGAGAGADGEDDPLLRGALEVAFESGKISTSLLQRRLSIGYGRAAKIIDRMEQLRYVSAPDGQKPRELLISRQEYMEKVMREGDKEQNKE